jgi:hypothetical protein
MPHYVTCTNVVCQALKSPADGDDPDDNVCFTLRTWTTCSNDNSLAISTTGLMRLEKIENMETLKANKDYIFGTLITALVGAIALVFGQDETDLPIVSEVLLAMVILILLAIGLATTILGISWIFTRKFSLVRLIKITTIICVVWTLSTVLSAVLNMAR